MTQSTYTHHDLRWGWAANAGRNSSHPARGAVAAAVVGSNANGASIQIHRTQFFVVADLAAEKEGIASFALHRFLPAAEGVEATGLLYTGVVACALPTAPLAWRYIMQRYAALAASAPPLVTISAPGPMPKEIPWMCGFSQPTIRHLSKTDREETVALAQLAADTLLGFCERAWAGADHKIDSDPSEYPELQDWSD